MSATKAPTGTFLSSELMHCELISCTTGDGVRLQGMLRSPVKIQDSGCGILCLHGVGGNFYSSTPFDAFEQSLASLGHTVLRVNTRGHDVIASPQGARRPQGSAYEVVDESRWDIAAWLEWLHARGVRRTVLLGHSLGGIKALYYAGCANGARHDDPENSPLSDTFSLEKSLDAKDPALLTEKQSSSIAPDCVIAISPPCLSYRNFCQGKRSVEFLDSVRTAENALREGTPFKLLDIRFPVPQTISASSFLDKYGEQERYNFLRWLDRLSLPSLFVYGALELTGNPAFERLPDILRGRQQNNLSVEVLENANHSYTGVYSSLQACIRAFLEQVARPA